MSEYEGEASEAELADMIATAIALVTAYSSRDEGTSREVIDMLDKMLPTASGACR